MNIETDLVFSEASRWPKDEILIERNESPIGYTLPILKDH